MQQQLIGNAHKIIEVANWQSVQISWKKYEELNNLKFCGCGKIKVLKNCEAASCREVIMSLCNATSREVKVVLIWIWQKERAFGWIVQHYRQEKRKVLPWTFTSNCQFMQRVHDIFYPRFQNTSSSSLPVTRMRSRRSSSGGFGCEIRGLVTQINSSSSLVAPDTWKDSRLVVDTRFVPQSSQPILFPVVLILQSIVQITKAKYFPRLRTCLSG